jgi:hypothetical protein
MLWLKNVLWIPFAPFLRDFWYIRSSPHRAVYDAIHEQTPHICWVSGDHSAVKILVLPFKMLAFFTRKETKVLEGKSDYHFILFISVVIRWVKVALSTGFMRPKRDVFHPALCSIKLKKSRAMCPLFPHVFISSTGINFLAPRRVTLDSVVLCTRPIFELTWAWLI